MAFPNLPPFLDDAITERGYEELTPVQDAVLKDDAKGRDLVVSAQTGSGKTVAFGLAMADNLLNDAGTLPASGEPQALIIAPTRELALQVSRELIWLYAKGGARIATCVGGMDASKERRTLKRGVHIVVGTPGRLRDHLERGALDLSALKVAVLDEADEMLDMGFREELEEILDATPNERRTLLFSATMPRQIENLARRYQKDSLRISTVGDKRGHGDISYQAITVSPSEIENAAVNLLRFHEAETAILFCGTREKVRHLHATLQDRGFAVVALSGEHSQQERNQAMQALRDKRVRVCVATDVAARGIDLPSLSLVIHVEVPRDAEILQHRSGRTGRAGRKGTAAIIVPYQRRRRVEGMLRGAKIEAEWIGAPTPEQIRQQDNDRMIATLLEPVEPEEQDRELIEKLMAERSPEEIAAALVSAHRAKMPAPEEMTANTPAARQAEQKERHRPGFEDTVWFRMDIGRRQNADPRWILPVLCRRGHVTKNEIGAIRIAGDETHFQIPRNIADKFVESVARTAGGEGDEGSVSIEQSDSPPREMARENKRRFKPGGGAGGRSGPGGGGKRFSGPRSDRPRSDGPRSGGKRFGGRDGDSSGGGRSDRQRSDRPRSDRPRSESSDPFADKSGFKGKPKGKPHRKGGGGGYKAKPRD